MPALLLLFVVGHVADWEGVPGKYCYGCGAVTCSDPACNDPTLFNCACSPGRVSTNPKVCCGNCLGDACPLCPAYFFCQGNAHQATPCLCSTGYHSPLTGQARCFGTDPQCLPCPIGYYCTGGGSRPTPCECLPGYTAAAATLKSYCVCTECTRGFRCKGEEGLPEPCECAPGFASTSTTSANCTGTSGTCEPCPVGFSCPGGSTQPEGCMECDGGQFSQATQSTNCSCVPCPPTFGCSGDGLASPCTCAPGTYSPVVGSSVCAGLGGTCQACEEGWSCAGGPTLPQPCQCAPGFISEVPYSTLCFGGGGTCERCGSGMACANQTRIACTCDPGYYSNALASEACAGSTGTCEVCPAGSYCLGGAEDPRPCNRNPSCSGDVTCSGPLREGEACPGGCADGSWLVDSKCEPCDDTHCKACPDGLCLTCLRGFIFSDTSGTCLELCPPGELGVVDEDVACAVDMEFCPEAADANSEPCPSRVRGATCVVRCSEGYYGGSTWSCSSGGAWSGGSSFCTLAAAAAIVAPESEEGGGSTSTVTAVFVVLSVLVCILVAAVISYVQLSQRAARKRRIMYLNGGDDATVRVDGGEVSGLQKEVQRILADKATEKIGEGEFCDVLKYRRDKSKYGVLKVLRKDSPIAREELRIEALSLGRISANSVHPAVIGLHFYIEAHPTCLGLECCTGSLKRALAMELFPPGAKASMAAQAAIGLAVVHGSSVAHLDVKTDNFLLTDDGKVKLADFGSARIAEMPATTGAERALSYTLQYVAPERLIEDAQPEDMAALYLADVYSFGAVLNSIDAQTEPFAGQPPHEVEKIVRRGGRPKLLADHRCHLQLVKACWSQRPSDRPMMTEVVAALCECLQQCYDVVLDAALLERVEAPQRAFCVRAISSDTPSLVVEPSVDPVPVNAEFAEQCSNAIRHLEERLEKLEKIERGEV